jgi:NAD kinase
MPAFDKVVVVTKKTALEELVERFNTRDQARFYVEHMGASFDEYQAAHDQYHDAVAVLKGAMPRGTRNHWIDRAFLPTFLFDEGDLIVTLGPDGLVVNTAKYLTSQPLLALNPDPRRVDGILVPFTVYEAAMALRRTLARELAVKHLTMARAVLNDGQSLHAVNDLFVGQRTHVSARYRLRYQDYEEDQSSSGIIISTGAGSTGWFRSVLTGAAGVMEAFSDAKDIPKARDRYRFDWEAEELCFSVREPFISKVSDADLVFGKIGADEQLEVISHMPRNGVIFSDGVEEDFLPFNSGAIARIGVAEKKLHLVGHTRL